MIDRSEAPAIAALVACVAPSQPTYFVSIQAGPVGKLHDADHFDAAQRRILPKSPGRISRQQLRLMALRQRLTCLPKPQRFGTAREFGFERELASPDRRVERGVAKNSPFQTRPNVLDDPRYLILLAGKKGCSA